MDTSLRYNPQVIFRKIGNETILVPIGENTESIRNIFTLNESATYVLGQIKEGKSLDEVYALIQENFETENTDEIKEWVNELVDEFKSNRIIL